MDIYKYDPILQEAYESGDDDGLLFVSTPYFNPSANYTDEFVNNGEFDPCGDWKNIREDMYVAEGSSSNYTYIFGAAKTKNQGESDLSRNAFGNTGGGKVAACQEPLFKHVEMEYLNEANYESIDEYSNGTGTATVGGLTFTTATNSPNLREVYIEYLADTSTAQTLSVAVRKEAVKKTIRVTLATEGDDEDTYGSFTNEDTAEDTCTGTNKDAEFTCAEGENSTCLDVKITGACADPGDTGNCTRGKRDVVCKGGAVTSTWNEVKAAIESYQAANVTYVTISGGSDSAASASSETHLTKTNSSHWVATGESYIDLASEILIKGEQSETNFDKMVACYDQMGIPVPPGPDGYKKIYTTPNGSSLPNVVKTVGEDTVIDIPITVYHYVFDSYGRKIGERASTSNISQMRCTIGDYVVGGIRTERVPFSCLVGARTCGTTEQVVVDETDPCFTFCEVQPVAVPTCYSNVIPGTSDQTREADMKMNNRRRAIMSDDPTVNNQEGDAGLLYMSIKGPGSSIFNVRVHHNLHQNFMLGENRASSPDDTVDQHPNTFTFNIPFCPKINHEYEYAVCNVPKAQHDNFGKSKDGSDRSIPNCFDTQAETWIVSNIRVANEKVGGWNGRWNEAYQLLKKTTFKVKKYNGKLVKDTEFAEACIPSSTGSSSLASGSPAVCADNQLKKNICDNEKKGVRYLQHNSLSFTYYAYPSGGSQAVDTSGDLFLYVDTNPNQQHWWHSGWKYKDEDGEYGSAIPDPGANDSSDYLRPTSISDPLYQCYVKPENENQLKSNIIHLSYSPLVVNLKNHNSMSLVGLDKEINFIGRRFYERKQVRYGDYDKMVSQWILHPENDGLGVLRTVVTNAYVKTGWIDGSKGDALLVLDLNQNGKVDSSYELFGEGTVMEKDVQYGTFGNYKLGEFAGNGFIALDQYDLNDDHLIDKAGEPELWKNLKLWQDGKDCEPFEEGGDYSSWCPTLNGEVDEGELISVEDAGIVNFHTGKIVKMNQRDVHGNETLYRSNYSYTEDGETKEGIVYDVYFTFELLTNEERNASPTPTEEEMKNMVPVLQ